MVLFLASRHVYLCQLSPSDSTSELFHVLQLLCVVWGFCYKREKTSLRWVVGQFFCTSSLHGCVFTGQLMLPWHPEDLREKTTKGGGNGGGRKYNPLSVFFNYISTFWGKNNRGLEFILFTINHNEPIMAQGFCGESGKLGMQGHRQNSIILQFWRWNSPS